MFEFLARRAFALRWAFLALGALVLLIGITYGTGVTARLKDTGTTSPTSESEREAREIGRLFPKTRESLIVLATSRSLTVEQPEYRREFESAARIVRDDESAPLVTDFYETHDSDLVSRNRRETFALVSVPGTDTQQQAACLRIQAQLARASFPDLTVQVGGDVAGDVEVNAEVPKDLAHAGLFSLPLLGLLLLIVFRSAVAALLPLLIGAIAVLGAFALTRVVTTFIDVSVFASNIIGLLGLGLAIDYSLLFVSRFRDELAVSDGDVPASLARSIKTAGESIFLSGSTVALSLLGILVFPEPFLSSMGLGGALAVLMAMAASLIVLPALLAVIGPWVNRLALPVPHPKSGGQPIWRAFGAFVVRHAAPILVGALLLLLAGGIPFLHVRYADPGAGNLPLGFTARTVAQTITRDFSGGANPPIEALVEMPRSPTDPREITELSYYAAKIQATPGVKSVRSLVTLDKRLGPAAYAALYKNPGKAARSALTHLVRGNITLISVTYFGTSQGSSTQSAVRAIRSLETPTGSVVLVGGDTASLVDRLGSLETYLPLAAAIIVFATYALLRRMLASVVIPIKSIVLNALSLSTAFGLMTWIFQEGHLQHLLHFEKAGSLDPTLPVLIFAIAFGLATDYEVFLVSRIKEEHDRTGDNSEAIVTGVEKTGGIVTAAGLLLVIVVAGFGTSSIVSMKEMGVGLAIAVAVDAAIVRTLLVPAAMQCFGRWNWWLPGKPV